MKLIFRPDPFTDSKGERIELEDIEIKHVEPDMSGLFTLFYVKELRYLKCYHGLDSLQKEIELCWNNHDDEISELLKSKRKQSQSTIGVGFSRASIEKPNDKIKIWRKGLDDESKWPPQWKDRE